MEVQILVGVLPLSLLGHVWKVVMIDHTVILFEVVLGTIMLFTNGCTITIYLPCPLLGQWAMVPIYLANIVLFLFLKIDFIHCKDMKISKKQTDMKIISFLIIKNRFFLNQYILIIVFPPSTPLNSSLPHLPSRFIPFLFLIRK